MKRSIILIFILFIFSSFAFSQPVTTTGTHTRDHLISPKKLLFSNVCGFTAASVPFAGAGGCLAEENVNFFYTLASNKLTLEGGVNIIPLAAVADHWNGFYVDGGALDPSVVSKIVNGVFVDFTGVALTEDPILSGIKISMPAAYSSGAEYGLNIDGGGKIARLADFDNGLYMLGAGTRISQGYDGQAFFTMGVVSDAGRVVLDVTTDGNDEFAFLDLIKSETDVSDADYVGLSVFNTDDAANAAVSKSASLTLNLNSVTDTPTDTQTEVQAVRLQAIGIGDLFGGATSVVDTALKIFTLENNNPVYGSIIIDSASGFQLRYGSLTGAGVKFAATIFNPTSNEAMGLGSAGISWGDTYIGGKIRHKHDAAAYWEVDISNASYPKFFVTSDGAIEAFEFQDPFIVGGSSVDPTTANYISIGADGIQIEDTADAFETSLKWDNLPDATVDVTVYGFNPALESADLAFETYCIMTTPKGLWIWDTDPGGGSQADYSGNTNTAAFHGTMTTTDLQLRDSGLVYILTLDGDNDYISHGAGADFSYPLTAVSWEYVIKVVDEAAVQIVWAKWDITTGTEKREWRHYLDATENLVIELYDEDNDVFCSRTTDSPLSVGFHDIIVTYDGGGGAAAADGITIYNDGPVEASTAANDGAFVQMRAAGTIQTWIGAQAGTGGAPELFLNSDLGIFGVTAEEYSATDVWKNWLKVRGPYAF